MPSKVTISICAVVLLAGAVLFIFEFRGAQVPTRQSQARITTIEAPQDPHPEGRSGQISMPPTIASVSPEVASEAVERPKQRVRTPEQIKEARREALDRLITIDRSFEEESRDNSWASEMETRIEEAVKLRQMPGTALLSVNCKTSFCRVEAAHEDSSSRASFELLKREMQGNYYIQQIDPEDPGGDGRYKSVLYFVRKGYEQRNVLYGVMYSKRDAANTVDG